jgi:O6-methylguanine-DNA--protein-cysteine methyltransferase
MPIRINLLAEAQASEELRRKDPVKRSAWIAGFFVSLVLLWILKLQCDIWFDQKDLTRINGRWMEIKSNYAAVTNNVLKTVEIDQKLAALNQLETNRFLWAPVLNALQKSVVNDVQMLHLKGQQTFVKEAARQIGTGATAKTIPGAMTENISLFIDAKDCNAGQQNYTKYKETLCASDFFVKSLGRRDGFVIDGTLSPPTADPSDPSRSFVTFALVSHFPEVRR